MRVLKLTWCTYTIGDEAKRMKHSRKGNIECRAFNIDDKLWAEVNFYVANNDTGTLSFDFPRQPQRRKLQFQYDEVKSIVSFALMMSIQSGKRYTTVLPITGEHVTLPVRYRIISIADMYKRYLSRHEHSISIDRFIDIVKLTAPYTTKTLAACDTVSEHHGRQNFMKFFEYLDLLQDTFPGDMTIKGMIKNLEDLIKFSENHLKDPENGFRSERHFGCEMSLQQNSPACHCRAYCF